MLGQLRRRWAYWRTNGERARLLREEMDSHIEMRTRELMTDGLTESEARTAARRQFGNTALIQEESRGIWIARWLVDLLQDSGFAARTLLKQPGFAAVSILSAGLGIGACSLIFAIANFALFRSLPVEEPSRLVSIYGTSRTKTGISLSYPDFEDLRKSPSLEGVTAFFQFLPGVIASHGEPQKYSGSLVTANYFDVVRPSFVLGRGFDPAVDDTAGQTPVVVLSHSLWRSRFGSDRAIVGRTIEINNRKTAVIGVTAPGFRGTEVAFVSDFWVPFSMSNDFVEVGGGTARLNNRGDHWLATAARLREGASLENAAAEVDVIARRIRAAHPESKKDRGLYVEHAGQVNPGMRRIVTVFFLLLLGVSVLVLLTACANIANLLLARASSRQKEIATRLAIGAGRGRLVRQLLTESLILSLLGGVAGLLLAQMGIRSIGSVQLPIPVPLDLAIPLDTHVVLFCAALSVMTGAVFGLAPALRATRPDLVGALKDEHIRFGRSRWFGLRNILVVAQVTICTVLLVCSGLFLRSLDSASNMETGMAHRNVLMMSVDPSLTRHTAGEAVRILQAVVRTVRDIPGVESASITSNVPLSMGGNTSAFTPDDKLADPEKGRFLADIYGVGTRLFETLGIRQLSGEDFPEGSTEDVVVVNKALADAAFAGHDPIGRRISYAGRMFRIIGMVATVKSRSIGEDPRPSLYFPAFSGETGQSRSLSGVTLVLRAHGNPASYAPLVRERIRQIDPGLAVLDARTMDTHMTNALVVPRSAAFLFGFAGTMGLMISAIGIYGVISFAVARQTSEIGIRMALGAQRVQVIGRILRQGLTLTVAGSILGLGIAFALSRLAASLLYGVSPTDAVTFTSVPVLLTGIALLACMLPARRAASLDPVRALRCD